MTSASQWRKVLSEVSQTGLCAHPVRLQGVVLDQITGELARGGLVVPCKDRRAVVCPSCSRLYHADAWQLVAAGLRGGKGVSPDVARHPQLFVTLTAPSFGAVHSRPRAAGDSRPCRIRRGAGRCPHEVSLSCRIHHGVGDPRLGEPLCPQCFDYPGAVLWNALVPRLWVRTTRDLYREIARATQISTAELRTMARLSYLKVVEFQRRGLVHLHVVVRADGSAGPSELPPAWLDAEFLGTCLRRAVAKTSVAYPDALGYEEERASWGDELDIRELLHDGTEVPTAVAAYVAKYATKTADGSAWLAHRIRSVAQLEHLELRPHPRQLVRTAWRLGQHRALRELNLRAHSHTFGYGGQFSSKSAHFSTTFAALRAARSTFMQSEAEAEFDYDGEWRYAGRGYDDPVADQLAEALFEASRRVR